MSIHDGQEVMPGMIATCKCFTVVDDSEYGQCEYDFITSLMVVLIDADRYMLRMSQ
jgi:hypothetical protein